MPRRISLLVLFYKWNGFDRLRSCAIVWRSAEHISLADILDEGACKLRRLKSKAGSDGKTRGAPYGDSSASAIHSFRQVVATTI